ncbi:MAG: polysaccharide deacetylase family protein, partial [Clostridia bacterium]|nr:polysaccharide deacetylase family protein [Clostridia bacterium]
MGYPEDAIPSATTVGSAEAHRPSSSATGSVAPVTSVEKPDTAPPVTDPPVTDAPAPEDTPVPTKRVAFTFDDGPHATLTYKFVDQLKEYGATATFFVVG